MNIFTKLETKIPPPVYGLLCALLMWWLDKQFPGAAILPAFMKTSGIVLILTGFSLDLYALKQFVGKHTTVNPLSPGKARSIVVSGLYHYTRNPMYLGMLTVLIGWALLLGNLLSFICLPMFVWVLTQMQIKPEERILAEKFGNTYTDYLQQVRRWL